jgi:hypothetical protein
MVSQFKFLQSNDTTVLDENWYRNYITYVPNDAKTHVFYVGVYCTQLILHYEGDMDIESVRSMLIDLTIRYRTCIYFTNLTLNNMEDFLNEHLDGTSTIRYV